MWLRIVPALLLAASAAVHADLKPDLIDCDGKKVARNAAMKATVGAHGPCDADKVMDDAKDDLGDKLDDANDNVKDKMDDAKDRDKKKPFKDKD